MGKQVPGHSVHRLSLAVCDLSCLLPAAPKGLAKYLHLHFYIKSSLSNLIEGTWWQICTELQQLQAPAKH